MILYDESMADYHGNGAIGSSLIRDFIRSPSLFYDKRQGLVPEKDSPALALGTMTHLALLEPERFRESVAIKPEDISFSTKIGKEWRDVHAGRTIISQADYCTIHMRLKRMPDEVRRLLVSGRSEVTVRTTLDRLAVQCRCDHWNETGNIIYDLKTIGAIEDVEREIYKRGYHVQAGWYQRVTFAETGRPQAFVLIFVEKAFPFRWRIVELDPDYQALAEQAIDGALHGIGARIASGCWEDPADLHLIASPPEWMTAQLAYEEA